MSSGDDQPYIPASQTLPEFTLQAVVLGVLLGFITTAANVYIALYAGMTVSASIPAAVISMGVLRGLLRRGTILENNIVHTTASSGSSLAAGTIFTVPALVILSATYAGIGWAGNIKFWETTLIAIAGGLLGVVMMIPLRRPMIIEQKGLRFPEGVACAEVLKAGDRGGSAMRDIVIALLLAAAFKALVDLIGLFKATVAIAFRVSKTGVTAAMDISPMLMAVGYIIGLEISLLVFLGGAISFAGALPILAWNADLSGDLRLKLVDIFREQGRFFGIGAMVVAGVYSILQIAPSIGAAVRTAVRGMRGGERMTDLPRTEQSISGRTLLWLLLVGLALSAVVYFLMTGSVFTTMVTAVCLFVLAFFFVAVASYIVGLVGTSNSPISGMTICAVLVTAGLLLVLGHGGAEGMLATLGVAGVVCVAASSSGDICQDLKIGQLVGATPRLQQTAQIIGTILPAVVVAPTMALLITAYGINNLNAPQAKMFASLIDGIFGKGAIPWHPVAWGAGVAVLAIVIDRFYLEPRNTKFRLYPMPLAVGMYLPWETSFPILFGGLAYWFVERRTAKRGEPEQKAAVHRGLLFASGLVAGEAMMGILIAALVVGNLGGPWVVWVKGGSLVDFLSLAALAAMTWFLIRKALETSEPRAKAKG